MPPKSPSNASAESVAIRKDIDKAIARFFPGEAGLTFDKLFTLEAPVTWGLKPADRAPSGLEARFCEEHLASVISLARQIVAERQLFYQTGERLSNLILSKMADEEAVKCLALETTLGVTRVDAAKLAQSVEDKYQASLIEYKRLFDYHLKQVDPTGHWAKDDASRESLRAYLATGLAHGNTALDPKWWDGKPRYDPGFADNEPEVPINAGDPAVNSLSLLAKRAALAGSRGSFVRAQAEYASIQSAVVASEGRASVLKKNVAVEELAKEVLKAREGAARTLEEKRKTHSEKVEYMGFCRQMDLHRSRAQDLFRELEERSELAEDGFEEIYGLPLPDHPKKIDLESVEQVLQWARECGRRILAYESRVVRHRMDVSMAERLGPSWRDSLRSGTKVDLSSLSKLGRVVRLRDIRATTIGPVSSQLVVLAIPKRAADTNIAGVPSKVDNNREDPLRLLSSRQESSASAVEGSAARSVHNLCPSGIWMFTAPDLSDAVEDLIVSLAVNCFDL